MTTVGDILDEFFSPLSSETLWIMPEDDDYTQRVRRWQPVIDAVTRTKNDLQRNSEYWNKNYRSNPTWRPSKTDAPKPGAYRDFVPSPPGTDPDTCSDAFVVYALSVVAHYSSPVLPVPIVQTENLYTCSIGSFNIYTTVDRIDCQAKSAVMDFWMYNNMSRRSFGRFASNPVFRPCGMQSQYMWWNWKESVEWRTGVLRNVIGSRPAGGW